MNKKKPIIIILTFLLIFGSKVSNVEAKTLGDLKNELAKQKAELNESKENKELTQTEMTNINSNIKTIQSTIQNNYIKIDKLNKEIEELNLKIQEKKEDIKKIVNFSQVSDGDSAYLEYVFGAENFTDMIYRSAVAEQLSEYNKNLIKEFNTNIESNKKKTEEIKQQKEELAKKQKELESKYSSLGNKLEDIVDIQVDIEETIKVQNEIIKMYEEKGCKDNENISVCGKSILPSDTKFWRPTTFGYISSNYGYRTYYINGSKKSDFHTGLDIAGSGIYGKPVYATANGNVAALTIKYKCGGNMVYIQHKIKGKYYTSLYMHLKSINVKKGQTVTKNTIIGYVGGANTPWDGCSTGAHVHFTLLTGLVGADYEAWSPRFYSSLLNPRNYVNFPSGGKKFSDRLTSY